MVLVRDAEGLRFEVVGICRHRAATGVLWFEHLCTAGEWSKVYIVDQNADVAAFLTEQAKLGLKPVKAPMPSKHEMDADSTGVGPVETKWFRSALMSVSWFTCQIRFDLSHTMSQLAQKMSAPTV